MKTITTYQCEICKQIHTKKSDAKKCEARGAPDLLPKGLIWLEKEGGRLCVLDRSSTYGHERHDVAWLSPPVNTLKFGGYRVRFERGEKVSEYSDSWRYHHSWREAILFLHHEGIRAMVLYRGKIVPLTHAKIDHMKLKNKEK